MIIVVPFAGESVSTEVADVMIASCKRAMPDVEVWQLTDETTKQLDGATGVIRRQRHKDWLVFFFEHMINLPEGEVLRLDYDVIVQRDVSPIFQYPFDIALTRRPLNDNTVGNFLRVKNPHNHGVVFIRRGRAFFQYALDEYLAASSKDGWMDAFYSLENAAASDVCRWIELPGDRYNYTPKTQDEDVSECSIVHYKGDRKHWMVNSPNARRDGDNVMKMLKDGSFGHRDERLLRS